MTVSRWAELCEVGYLYNFTMSRMRLPFLDRREGTGRRHVALVRRELIPYRIEHSLATGPRSCSITLTWEQFGATSGAPGG